ncbi:MAG TPA: transcriptional regulator [Syntrophomonadaceae bacterium]|nr:transcriptional regulator [Syntrophomonadaceae bacterium]
MDINSIPDIFQSKLRIAIVSCLMTGEKAFKEVKEITGATDGNLSVQISKMEESGYVKIHKDFFNNKPRTRYNLTAKGKAEFIDYVNALDKVIRQYNDGEK